MDKVTVGKKVPSLELDGTHGKFKLNDYAGKYVVLYFYPKDNTPGCTQEGHNFSELYSKFQAHNAEIFGISRDSVESHRKFKAAQEYPFDLLSDTEQTACKMFGVLDLDSNPDPKACRMFRTTFLIDPNGVLVREWRKVSVANHANEVYKTLL